MHPKLQAILELLKANSRPEFSDENLEIRVEADNPEDAQRGLNLAKEVTGQLQDLPDDLRRRKKKMDEDEEGY